MLIKQTLSSISGAILIVFVLATSVMAAGILNIANPEQVRVPALVPPLLAPPGETGYVNQVSSAITAPDGRPIAQFGKTPAQYGQTVAVDLPQSHAAADANSVSYTILSSVRYTGNGHTVLVTTARPSGAAAARETALGQQTIKLKDGTTAWTTTNLSGSIPNQVVFVRSNLIVTVAGNVPLNTLQDLAAQVVIKSGK